MSAQKTKITSSFVLKSPRNFRRRWAELWNNLEWPVVGLIAIGSLLLGAKGYADYYHQAGNDWDYLYLSLQLFVLQASFDIGKSVPDTLQIARFLAPAIGAYTLFQIFLEVFRKQLQLLRLYTKRNHIIICGLGQKGLLLAKDHLKTGQYVVVIEQDSSNSGIDVCRELGVFVFIGDARDSLLLRKAGVKRAKYLFAVCGDDGINVEVAEQSRALCEGYRKNALTCVLHITDTQLWTLLRERMFSRDIASSFRTELFNVYDTGARILLHETWGATYQHQPHLLVIGLGELAEHLILRATQKWCIDGHLDQLLISIIDPNIDQKLGNLKAHYPLVAQVCRFYPYKCQTNWPEFQTGAFLNLSEPNSPISHVYICFDDTRLGLQAGFVLLRLLQDQRTQIVVRMTENASLSTFLKEIKNMAFDNLHAFGLLDRTCGIGLFDDGTHEHLARIIHEDYFHRETQKGLTQRDNPALIRWEDLPEKIREANRRQADRIGIKLATIGCGMEPWRDYGRENFIFSPEEIIKMSQMEHNRWCDEKFREGWKRGKMRDDARKLHPDLRPWEELDDNAKDKDILTVKLIPGLLARAGFQIYRIKVRA